MPAAIVSSLQKPQAVESIEDLPRSPVIHRNGPAMTGMYPAQRWVALEYSLYLNREGNLIVVLDPRGHGPSDDYVRLARRLK